MMTGKQRLEAAFDLREPDRTPVLAGWIACHEHLVALAGATAEDYRANPRQVAVEAYRRLGADGLMGVFLPKGPGEYRCVDEATYRRAVTELSLQGTLERIDAMPGPEKVEADFDFDAAYQRFVEALRQWQALCEPMLWMPAQWDAGARVVWYEDFGYENYFCVVGLHTDRARKLMEVGGAMGRCKSRVVARAVREGLYPRACLLGEDICTQRGPMLSPAFMEKHYMPQLAYGLEPLLEAGCRPVWHSDGDVRQIMDLLIAAGVRGFQGFQPECGMTLDHVTSKRTRDGEPLLIFGPLAVTTELPVCTPQEIAQKVQSAVRTCRGRASLVLFVSNTICPDVPLENIVAMHEAARGAA